MWCLWHYHNSMTTGENTWTCNTSRDKGAYPWCESLSVTAVCGEGSVMELRKRKSIIAQLSVNWVGRGKQTHAHSLTLHFMCFPILSHSSYIPCALLSSYSSLQWNIREGMDSVPETRSCREPSVILSLLDRFLEQEWRNWVPSLRHFR